MKIIYRDISIYSIGEFLSKVIGFLAIIAYAHFLNKDEIGIYGYTIAILGLFNSFFILGLDNAYARYFFEYKTINQRQKLTTTLLVFLLFLSLIFLIIIFWIIEDIAKVVYKNEEYNSLLYLAFLSIPLRLISSILNQALRNQFKVKLFVFLNFINALATVISSIFFIIFTDLKISGLFIGIIIGDLVVLPIRLFAIKELITIKIDLHMLKNLLKFGIPFLPTSIGYWIFGATDRIMLEKMTDLENVAIYTIALSFTSILTMLSSAIGQAWSPHAVNVYEGNKEIAIQIFNNFLRKLIIILVFIIFCISLFGKEILIFLFPESYSKSFYPMLLLSIGVAAQITTQVTAIGLSLSKRTIYFVYVTWFVAIVNIGLNYYLIPVYAETGAAIATMISNLLLTVIYGFFTKKFINLPIKNNILFMSLILLVLILLLSSLGLMFKIFLFLFVILFLYQRKDKIKEVFN